MIAQRMLLAGLLALLLCRTAAAAAFDCSMASQSYNSAIDVLSLALKGYTRCVNDSQGFDDCSLPFNRLRTAHVEFENATSDVGRWCHR